MKILIDTTPLLKSLTGVGYVTYMYAKQLRRYPDNYLYYYAWFCSDKLKEKPLDHFESAVKLIKRLIPRPYLLAHAIKTLIFNAILFIKKPDLFFQPNYISFPMLKKVPTVTMVHDLSHIHFAQFHPPERVEYFNKELKRSLDASDVIVAISEYTKKDLIKQGLAKEEKIEVVYNGVAEHFKPLAKHTEAKKVLKKYGVLAKEYFLFVGTLEPRKNLQLLLEAYVEYHKHSTDPTPLLLAGGIGWRSEYFDAILQEALRLPEVKRLGYVSDEELAILYAGAKVFIFPSLYEGFGLPPLEAMASGTAVIASNSSSIPEVVGEAGILIDPYNKEELLEAMNRLDSDEALRKEYEKRGIERAKIFSWDKSVAKLHAIFENVYAKNI